MTITREEIRRLNKSSERLRRLMEMVTRANKREREAWENILVQKIRNAQFNKIELKDLHITVDIMISNRK